MKKGGRFTESISTSWKIISTNFPLSRNLPVRTSGAAQLWKMLVARESHEQDRMIFIRWLVTRIGHHPIPDRGEDIPLLRGAPDGADWGGAGKRCRTQLHISSL